MPVRFPGCYGLGARFGDAVEGSMDYQMELVGPLRRQIVLLT